MKSKLLIAILATTYLVPCKKNNTLISPETPITDVAKAYKEIATVVIITAKNDNNFRNVAYAECNKQKYGDYYFKLEELIAHDATHKYWNAATINKLADLEKSIKQEGKNDVIIFIPSIEKHPEKATANRIEARTERYEEPVAVIATEYDNPTQTSSGYIVDNNGVLAFHQKINESFAWKNDVWVAGKEEIVSPENMVAAAEETATLVYARVKGGAEYEGIAKKYKLVFG